MYIYFSLSDGNMLLCLCREHIRPLTMY